MADSKLRTLADVDRDLSADWLTQPAAERARRWRLQCRVTFGGSVATCATASSIQRRKALGEAIPAGST